LVEYRRALGGGLGEVPAVDAVVRTVVPDAVDPCRICEDAAGPVASHGVRLPAALPELIGGL
jgi:hypothetical protein